MLIGAFVLFLVLWLLGFVVFHVASWAIHILLVIAVIALVMHFFRGGRRLA